MQVKFMKSKFLKSIFKIDLLRDIGHNVKDSYQKRKWKYLIIFISLLAIVLILVSFSFFNKNVNLNTLNKEEQSEKIKILLYSSWEIVIKDQEKAAELSLFNLGRGKHPNIDYSQKIKYEEWSADGYSKTLITQNGKVIVLDVLRPDLYFSYIGGEYAVEQKKYPGGEFTRVHIPSPDLLSDNGFVGLKTFTIDGGKTFYEGEIVEEDSMRLIKARVGLLRGIFGEGNGLETFSYSTLDTQRLVKYEQYSGDTLVVSVRLEKLEENYEDFIDKVFNAFDLKDKEVKTVKMRSFTVNTLREKSIEKFMQKYPVFIVGDEQMKDDIVAFYFKRPEDHELVSKLINSTEFNPLYNPKRKEEPRLIAAYSSQNANIEVNIYDTKPSLVSDNKYYIEVKFIEIKLNNKKVKAESYIKIPKYSQDDDIAPLVECRGLIFEYGGLWYEVKAYYKCIEMDDRFAEGFEMRLLLNNEAVEIDNRNKNRWGW